MKVNITLYTIPQEACDSKKMNWIQAGEMLKEHLLKNIGKEFDFHQIEFMSNDWFVDAPAQEIMEKENLKFPFVLVNGALASTGDKIKLSQVIRKAQEMVTQNEAK